MTRRGTKGAAWLLFSRTIRPLYLSARRGISHVVFERPRGIHTETVVRLQDIGLVGEHRSDYVASGWLTLRRILPRREVSEHDVFVDFGSGMGRVVLQASRYPFRRIIGVELSPRLNEIARENVRRVDRGRGARIELVTADVLDYQVPDDVTVAYFNNPFTGPVFGAVVDKLAASLRRNPRLLRVIYFNPVEEERLLLAGARPQRRTRGLRPTASWSRSNSAVLYTLSSPGDEAGR